MTPDQIIHEATGKCWHEWRGHKDENLFVTSICTKCGVYMSDHRINPSYSRWENYGPALDWAKKQEWWSDFLTDSYLHTWMDHTVFEEDLKSMIDFLRKLLTPSTGRDLLAEFLEGRTVAKKP